MRQRVISVGVLLVCVALVVAPRLRAQNQPISLAQTSPVSTTWNSSTAVNTVFGPVTTTGFTEAIVRLNGTAPLTDGQLVFEGDDGTLTFGWRLAGQRSDATGKQEDAPQIIAQTIAWTVPVAGWTQFRVRLLTPITSSGSAALTLSLSAAASTEPTTAPIAAALQQLTAALNGLRANQATRMIGSFGQTLTSTGGALNTWLPQFPFPLDPCLGTKGNLAISQTASTVLISSVPGTLFVCSAFVVGADAENVSFVEGTGSTCGTGTAAVNGGTTAANGPNSAANGGFVLGGANATVMRTRTARTDFCLLQSGAGRVAGNITYVILPGSQ